MSVDFDIRADKEILERLASLVAKGPGGGGISLSISGRDVAVKVSAPGKGVAVLDAREVGFAPKGEEIELSMSGGYRVEPLTGGLGPVSGPLSLSGSLSRSLDRARLELGLAATAKALSLRMQRFELIYSGSRLELRKIGDEAPIDAELGLDLADGTLTARMLLDGFIPQRSVRVSGALAWLSPWLATPYSGSLSFSLPRGDLRRIAYAAKIEGALPRSILDRSPHVALVASGDAEGMRIDYARIGEGEDQFEYRGSFSFADRSPDGVLDLRLSLLRGTLPVAASLRVYGHEGEYAAVAERVAVAGASFRDLAAAAAWRGDQVDFRLSFLLPETGELEGGDTDTKLPSLPARAFSGEAGAGAGTSPIVRCEGSATVGPSPAIDCSVSIESADLGSMRSILEAAFPRGALASFLAGLRFGGEAFLSSDFKRFSWSAPDLAVVSASMPGAYALLSLSGTSTSLTIRKASLVAAGYDVEGEGKVDFAQGGGIGFEAGFKLRDVPYKLAGSLVGGNLSVTGDYGISISARATDDAIVTSLEAKELPLPIAGGHVFVSAEADGRFVSADDWKLALASLALVPVGESLARVPRLTLAGAFGPAGGELRELTVADKYSTVSGPARIEYSLASRAADGARTPAARIVAALVATSTSERYDLDLSYSGGELGGGLVLTGSPLARLGEPSLAGSVEGDLRLAGALSAPRLAFDAKLRDARYREQSIEASAAGSYADDILSIRNASVSYLGRTMSGIAGSFSLRDASSSVALSFSGLSGGDRLSFSVEAAGTSLEKGGGNLRSLMGSYSLDGTVKDFKYGAVSAARWPFAASVSPSSGVKFTGGTEGELSFSYAFDGEFDLETRQPLPLRLLARGKVVGDRIEAEAEGIELDLPLLSMLFRPDDLQFVAGVARGDLRVSGLLADPEMNGRLDLGGATLKVPGWIGDPIGPFDAPVFVDGRSLSSSAPLVPVGKAAVSYRAQAGLDHWVPASLKAVIRSVEGGQVKLDTAFLGIQIAGQAAFELDAEIKGDTVFLGGKVALDKAEVVVSPEGWAAKASAQGGTSKKSSFLSVDMAVDLGRGVNVIFPSKELPIVSGYADKPSSLSVRYDEATSDLLLRGTVMLRGGDVFYIQRNFFLKSARLVFNETIDRFAPRVTLLAELRDRNEEGPVTITLSAEDEPITDFKPRMSSDPTMTEAQIAALLGQNLLGVGSEGAAIDVRKAVISGSEFIPQINVGKAFESRVREALGLDIFYFRTQVIQRWLIDLSGQSAEASSAEDPLARYLDETAIYAGKYIGDSVFLYGSARLTQDEDPLVRAGGLSINSELGVEFDTPFGFVQWTVAPSSPENLFINDQSLSVSWKLSY